MKSLIWGGYFYFCSSWLNQGSSWISINILDQKHIIKNILSNKWSKYCVYKTRIKYSVSQSVSQSVSELIFIRYKKLRSESLGLIHLYFQLRISRAAVGRKITFLTEMSVTGGEGGKPLPTKKKFFWRR